MRHLLVLLACGALTLTAQTKKIIVNGASPSEVQEFQSMSSKVKIVPVTRESVLTEIADADAYIGEITPEQVRAAKKLQWVQVMSAGVERVLHLSGGNDLRDSNIVLTNNQIVQGPEIADHAFALLLSLTRGIAGFVAEKQSNAPRQPYRGVELNTKTAVVIGVGGIGTQISIRAWAFGMNVIGVDPEDIPMTPFIKRVVKPDQLDEVLPLADVVFVSTPHTPKSHKMLGPKQIGLMKQNSYFIAVSRGATYDIDSVVKGLDEKRIVGVGVDVTDPEPLPKSHALWQFPNAIITPHIAGRSDLDRGRMVGTIKENIRRFADGKPLINVVDKQKGY